jgi:hypothetical protein
VAAASSTALSNAGGKMTEKIRMEHNSLGRMIWFGGWLFTLGLMKLTFWKGVVALFVWPFYLGTAVAMRLGGGPNAAWRPEAVRYGRKDRDDVDPSGLVPSPVGGTDRSAATPGIAPLGRPGPLPLGSTPAPHL